MSTSHRPAAAARIGWTHLKENGFKVEVTETNNLNPIKIDAGLTPSLASCHTAFVGDYVIEGHVPANDIHRLIAQAPKAKGLSVPGMPAGSPGMEVGDRKDRYQVLMFNDSGQTKVFRRTQLVFLHTLPCLLYYTFLIVPDSA